MLRKAQEQIESLEHGDKVRLLAWLIRHLKQECKQRECECVAPILPIPA